MNRTPSYQYSDKHVEMESEPRYGANLHDLNVSLISSSSSSTDPVSIFNVACTEFRSSLSKEQLDIFQEYPNAKSMLTAVQSQAQNHPSQKSTLMRCCKGVSALAERLDPFFEIVSLFVSSHPEFAAIAWGSLRLVFLLGTNHAQFLKGVCELFQAMSLKLPIYEDFIRKWTSLHSGRQPPVRLITAMAYIYADLIQFCFDICQIFSRKRSGFLSIRGSFIHSLYKTSLNPFNVRYDVLLRRWDEHQSLVELEISICTDMEQLETVEKIDRILKKFSEKEMFEDDRHTAWRNVDFINQNLQAWINSPAWLTLFEIAQRQREMDSTEWFIDHELVSTWISHKEDECASSQVLWVLGKPGFGKTTLCTTLIETLQKRHTANQEDRQVALTFFYFNKQRRDSVSSGAVWRAVLMQLFNIMPAFDPDVMDCFLLFRESSKASGQPVASDNEILAVLCLLIQRLDHLILIVDGIDECEDQMQFWRCLDIIRGGSTTVSVALFSRPSVMLPGTMKSSTATLHLDSALNLDDICLFLRPRIMSILDSGLLPQLCGLDEMVDQIARRASGMFLWASLFVEYIQSPHLSTRERRHALQNLNRLQGLDLLYDAILKCLIQRGSGARSSTVQVFEFVMHSIRPLHITELQHVIAIPLDRSLEPDDLIPGFARNLGLLSGALMEIDQNGFVRFVHLSIIEYLGQAKNRSADGYDVLSEFVVDSHKSHVSLACRCLSYLYHTVTPEPLAGSSRITPDRESVVKKYPFLDYATEFWSFHALECTERVATSSEYPLDGTLVHLASSFLSNKPSIMAWIEASWMFSRPPVIRHGPCDVFLKDGPRLPLQLDAHLKTAWETAWKTLLQLSKSLDAVNSSWAHILQQEPNEIWEPSISAFNESPFWQRISGAKIVARFDAETDPGFTSIHLKSRISSDGRHVGLIRLHISQHEDACNTIFFELWSMEPNMKLNEVNLRIPRSCLKPFLYGGDSRLGVAPLQSFQCPVALTAELQRVVAPGCVVDIRLWKSDPVNFSADNATQFIDFTGNAWRHGPFKFGLEDFQFKYDIQVSDTGRYLATIHKSNGLVDVGPGTSCHLRLVTVYEDTSTSATSRASYRHVASLAFKPVYTNDMEGEWCALLHPKYPIVVVKFRSPIVDDTMKAQFTMGMYSEDGAGIWNFEASGKRRFRYIDCCPEELVFDYDGEFFCNERLNDWQLNTLPDISDGHLRTENLIRGDAFGVVTPSGKAVDSGLPYRTIQPPVQKSRELSCYVDKSGLRSVSQLETSERGVVLATLREDGVMEAEMVARLPQSISGDHQAIMLNLAEGQGPSSRVLFLDRENRPFQTHSIPPVVETKPTEQLPLVLRRARETIPKVVSEGKYAAEGFDLEHKARKRLSWFTGEQVAKRRHTDGKSSEIEAGEQSEV